MRFFFFFFFFLPPSCVLLDFFLHPPCVPLDFFLHTASTAAADVAAAAAVVAAVAIGAAADVAAAAAVDADVDAPPPPPPPPPPAHLRLPNTIGKRFVVLSGFALPEWAQSRLDGTANSSSVPTSRRGRRKSGTWFRMVFRPLNSRRAVSMTCALDRRSRFEWSTNCLTRS